MSVATDGASASEDIQVHSGIEGAKGVQPFGAFERMLAMRYIRAKREHGGLALISIVSAVKDGNSVTVMPLATMSM